MNINPLVTTLRFGFTPQRSIKVLSNDFHHRFHFLGGALQGMMLRFGFQPVGSVPTMTFSASRLVFMRRRLRR